MGRLGMRSVRVPPGHSACPAHTHLQADEIFVVLEGKGLFRYGDHVYEIHPGDCISCPADTGIAHQIANPPPPADVCTYPDSGSISVGGRQALRALARGWILRGATSTHTASDA